MRNTIVGVAAAALFLAALFALPKFFPRREIVATPGQIAAKIEPGFVGARKLGPWILGCRPNEKKNVPMPFTLGPAKTAGPALIAANQLGRCRVVLAFHRAQNPSQIILLITFRLLGPAQRLAMIVHMPPIAKAGDQVSLVWGNRGVNLPVAGCEKGNCVATGALAPQQEAELLSQASARLALPRNPAGKHPVLDIPFTGLRAAVDAMRSAEAGG